MLLGLQDMEFSSKVAERKMRLSGRRHLNIKIIVKPGLLESWVIKKDWFQD